MMTTRAHLADDTTFDYDEETQAHPTHVNDQAVIRRVFTGPTPAKAAGPAGETAAQKRDRLRAELAALDDDDEPAGPGRVFPPVA
jgi:hypothetical protein